MTYIISEWSDISGIYKNSSLLLGNGSSISVDPRFSYKSLVEHAKKNNFLNESIQQLFGFFKTNDFELILRLVWQAYNVNIALSIDDVKTRNAYINVRECLIETVRSIHPEYDEIAYQLPAIYNFIKEFRTIVSLNYDVILYWAMMYGRNKIDGHDLKDCFVHNNFHINWRQLREPRDIFSQQVTLVFYPHGNLILARDNVETDCKILSNHGQDLLESILTNWQSGSFVPLFVSEGTSTQKIKSINSSVYLNTVYREVLINLGTSLVIYGWGLGEQDAHILNRLKQSWVRSVAVSVYNNDQAYCYRVAEQIHQILGEHVSVHFFNCNSQGCWNNV